MMNTVAFATRHVPVWHRKPERASAQSHEPQRRHHVLVLGNAYRLMPYQEPLAILLAQAGFDAYWSPLRGQPESLSGRFSLRGAASDIEEILASLQRAPSDCVSLIGHCASSLAVIEYLGNRRSDVCSAVLYSPLTNGRRLSEGARLLDAAGVRHELSAFDKQYSAVQAVAKVEVPLLLMEVTDRVNRQRTSHDEMQRLADAGLATDLRMAAVGYDEELSHLDNFANTYASWLRKQEQIRDAIHPSVATGFAA